LNIEKFQNSVREPCYIFNRPLQESVEIFNSMFARSIYSDVGFQTISPRKQNITLYVHGGSKKQESLLKKLGKYSTGKGCLYIKKRKDVDTKMLRELVKESAKKPDQ